MSGTIPSFMDFIGNFRGSSYHVDNLLVQFQRSGKRIVFYGDDTWLKLFPNVFHRFEGVTSFFVTVCETNKQNSPTRLRNATTD
jgi:ethanolaminephosphotransferase